MKTVFTNVNILDGTLSENGEMGLLHGDIAIENGKFVADTDVASGDNVVDLGGRYMMPGLINMHIHIAAAGGPEKKKKKPTNYKKLFNLINTIKPAMMVFEKLVANNAKQALLGGSTTIRTVGGVLAIDGKVRDQIAAGKKIGPRIISCNTAVSVPGGHFAGSLATEADSPEMAREHVRAISSTKPDWIKLMVTGGVMDSSAEGEPGVLRMPPELIYAACDEAHKLGYKVCAHVESTEGVRAALENGVDSVEHGALLNDELVNLFKEKNAICVCTIAPTIPYCYCENISNEMGKRNAGIVANGIVECAKTCIKEGIPVGLGTDAGCPYTTPYDQWRELVLWTKLLGVSNGFAINSATEINAKLLGISDTTGTIAVGKSADFIVLDNNPLEDLHALRNLYMVSSCGKIIKRPRPKKNKVVEETLDALELFK